MAGIFDKMVAGINKGVNSVSEGSKVLVEKAKINTEIENMERERDRLFANMGRLVYNLHHDGNIEIEQCKGICDSITRLGDQIETMKKQIAELEAPKQQYYGGQAPMQDLGGCVQCRYGLSLHMSGRIRP